MDEPKANPPGPPRSASVEQCIDLELRLCVEEGSASPRGYIRDRSGSEQSFQGWLGLLGLLEETTQKTKG
jgi:hypothetical protein